MRRWLLVTGANKDSAWNVSSLKGAATGAARCRRSNSRGTEATETLKGQETFRSDLARSTMPVWRLRSRFLKRSKLNSGGLDVRSSNAGIAGPADGLPSQTDVAPLNSSPPTLLARCRHTSSIRIVRSQPAVALANNRAISDRSFNGDRRGSLHNPSC